MKIYHNPKCSKSRNALSYLEEKGLEFEVVKYLEVVPSEAELKDVLGKLGISARELLRKGEDAYKENNLKNPDLSDDQIVAFMVKYPKLIERPIIVKGEKAVIARPIENLIEMVENE